MHHHREHELRALPQRRHRQPAILAGAVRRVRRRRPPPRPGSTLGRGRAREAQGESIRLAPRLYPAAGAEQEARRITDPFEELIELHLGSRTGKVRSQEVWAIVGKADGGDALKRI